MTTPTAAYLAKAQEFFCAYAGGAPSFKKYIQCPFKGEICKCSRDYEEMLNDRK
jgi:hypothetical protein